ncbi:lysophospholipid acyltransferase family protein [Desertibacillus haloalkaliphilus]|uniref:lysophospholipid acyltransferase family protein n=1 Tax=Desertibacillus haloalkaliphilus TaxID=1328930 RepID=UPI001C253AE9|nr:lysophospholipid acyltransferase family protein [Desertibacillus haloalkaliphilus]MBU8907224.1 1-acyl-sn-glycerol-3-phosphate acyltransferase [Desertibacillus haloalkaliphilus]
MDLYTFGKNLFKSYFSVFYRIEVIGADNLPKDGGILLCSNHINNLDPPLVGACAPRRVHFMAKAELFNVPLLKHALPRVGAFPVKRGMSDKQALRSGLSILKENKVLGLFPEGTRSKNGELGKGLAGAGFFALRTDAYIVPCAIIGPYKLFNKVKIIYGEPIDFTEFREQKKSVEEATEYIMNSIKSLIDQHSND